MFSWIGIVVLLDILIVNAESETGCTENDKKHQRIDGKCNNMEPGKDMYGAANTRFRRLCPKSDEVLNCDQPDGTGTGGSTTRPDPQTVCETLFKLDNTDQDDGGYTALHTYFGQFLDHDITLTLHGETKCTTATENDQVCEVAGCFNGDQCAIVQPGSTEKCFEFIKSTDGGRKNAITTYIDASNVYGSSEEKISDLRGPTGGKLKVYDENTRCGDLLPKNEDDKFFAGDIRAAENPILLSLHTVFHLEHNRLADEVKQAYIEKCDIEPDNDQIFKIARKINIAQMQKIVLKEYLPELGINIKNTRYDNRRNPAILQEFSTAAYRFGHSGVKNKFTFVDDDENDVMISLQQLFFNTEKYEEYCPKNILRRQWDIRSEKIDNKISKSIGQKLFVEDTANFETKIQSLCALNVQRGRDHKLGSYKCLLKTCLKRHRKRVDAWEEATGEMLSNIGTIRDLNSLGLITSDNYLNLLRLYNYDETTSLDNVDIFTAGLLEEHWVKRHRMGPTFNCILSRQFNRLVRRDRFFYTNCNDGDRACQAQRCEIEKRTFADILCDNLYDENTRIKRYVLSRRGGRKKCKKSHKLDYKLWIDCPQAI